MDVLFKNHYKSLRGLETGLTGLDEIIIPEHAEGDEKSSIRSAIAIPSPDRLRYIAEAMRAGLPLNEIHQISKIDPWF